MDTQYFVAVLRDPNALQTGGSFGLRLVDESTGCSNATTLQVDGSTNDSWLPFVLPFSIEPLSASSKTYSSTAPCSPLLRIYVHALSGIVVAILSV